jgi:hypothetical protein
VLENSKPEAIHAAVYGALARVPPGTRAHLLGQDQGPSPAQIASFRDRANNPEHFVEFLPCFAIRPLYIELLHVLRKFGVGLLETTVIASVLSYIALAGLVFVWCCRYLGHRYAVVPAILLAIAPSTLSLARYGGPDSLSTFWTLLSLYLIFEQRWLCMGLVVLLSSIYVRTDNVLLVLVVLAYLWLISKEMNSIQSAVLAVVSLVSVFVITHFAGDYGWRMLYYRAFIAIPIAPGEFTARFSLADYERALRAGTSALLNSSFIPYLLLATIGWFGSSQRQVGRILAITLAFTVLHFVLLPSVADRYFGLFYIVTGLSAILALAEETTQPSFGAPVAS